MASIDRTKYLFVGVDLHKKTHVAVLCNCFGDVMKQFKITNAPNHFPAFLEDVKKHAEGKDIIFGLEDVNFYGRSLAKFLIANGYIVKEVNSSYTKKKRNKGTNRNKTDELDAKAICMNLIMEYDAHPVANPQDIYLAIKQTLSTRNNYVKMVANMKLSLHNLLIHHYPNYTDFFKDLESKTARGFFNTYPSCEMVANVSAEELTKTLQQYNKSVPKAKAQEILDAIAANGWADNGYQEERNQSIRSYIQSIEHLEAEIAALEKQLDRLIDETGYPLKTIHGVDTVLAATFIANIGDINRFKHHSQLAKLAGIAPIEHSSGELQNRYSNKLGNRELNKAFYSLALTQIRQGINPLMYEYYQKKIKEGRKKKQAMVYVARRLVSIVFSIMKNKTPYRPPVIVEAEAVGA